MTYDLTGKVKLVQEPQTFSSGFTKREVVVTVEDGKYPQEIVLEFLQDKASLLDNVSEGQEIKVFFDIRGREYNGRYFNNLGVCYHLGRGVPRDYKEAVKWFLLSAEQGHAKAQFNLGACYRNGQGVPRNIGEAVRWMRLSAEQGHTDAQHYLGMLTN